jgi:hypothetical protein
MRYKLTTVSLMLLCCSCVFAQFGTTAARLKPCRSHPRLVGKCFMVHGRLSNYLGGPSTRLWRVGSHRMLGVSDIYGQAGYRIIPTYLEKLLEDGQTEVWGDYLVCPLTREKSREMQMVCIDSGKHLFSRKRP